MLRWLSAGILGLVFLLGLALPVHADTGTYRITNYVVTLEPQSSGAVKMTYEQTWQVLTGNIPWITVGLANTSYSVQSFGGAARSVYADNGNGFTGVRADLDRTYLPGETFKISFVVLQNNLLERLTSEKQWRINFTPGWYDRAPTDHLQINLVSPVSLDSYSLVSPVASSSANNTITWERSNLPNGGRFTVVVESLDGSFLTATAPSSSSGSNPWPAIIGILIAAMVIGLIVVGVRKAKQARDAELRARIAATEKELAEDKTKEQDAEKGFREYVIEEDIKPDAQGRYYDRRYGDYITPAIWMAVLSSQQRNLNTLTGSGRSGGAGGFSCACACVSCACACACACAGGGAAGCSRKTLHECSECTANSAAGCQEPQVITGRE